MKRIFEKVKDVVTLQLLRNELTTSVRDEGKAVRDCIYEQFSRLFNDRDTNKEVVNGATIMICIFMLVIGFALGWLSSLFLV